jgi:hypothetical protein
MQRTLYEALEALIKEAGKITEICWIEFDGESLSWAPFNLGECSIKCALNWESPREIYQRILNCILPRTEDYMDRETTWTTNETSWEDAKEIACLGCPDKRAWDAALKMLDLANIKYRASSDYRTGYEIRILKDKHGEEIDITPIMDFVNCVVVG